MLFGVHESISIKFHYQIALVKETKKSICNNVNRVQATMLNTISANVPKSLFEYFYTDWPQTLCAWTCFPMIAEELQQLSESFKVIYNYQCEKMPRMWGK